MKSQMQVTKYEDHIEIRIDQGIVEYIGEAMKATKSDRLSFLGVSIYPIHNTNVAHISWTNGKQAAIARVEIIGQLDEPLHLGWHDMLKKTSLWKYAADIKYYGHEKQVWTINGLSFETGIEDISYRNDHYTFTLERLVNFHNKQHTEKPLMLPGFFGDIMLMWHYKHDEDSPDMLAGQLMLKRNGMWLDMIAMGYSSSEYKKIDMYSTDNT